MGTIGTTGKSDTADAYLTINHFHMDRRLEHVRDHGLGTVSRCKSAIGFQSIPAFTVSKVRWRLDLLSDM